MSPSAIVLRDRPGRLGSVDSPALWLVTPLVALST